MHDSQLRPKKSLGQHFLTDANVIRRIVDSVPSGPDEHVVEIGPGMGALTESLLERHPDLILVELDQRMVAHLEERFRATYPGMRILHQDVIKGDWLDQLPKGRIHVVGNLPYYNTSQILFKVFEHRARFTTATFMMQKEVADRVVAEQGSKTYGILSVQSRMMSTPDILFDVRPGSFRPPPKVMSSVVRFTFDRPPLRCGDAIFKQVVRTAFQQRRKRLSNALKPLLDTNAYPGFDFSLRAEAWPPQEYERLAESVEQVGTPPGP